MWKIQSVGDVLKVAVSHLRVAIASVLTGRRRQQLSTAEHALKSPLLRAPIAFVMLYAKERVNLGHHRNSTY